jgi:hypothetical protein
MEQVNGDVSVWAIGCRINEILVEHIPKAMVNVAVIDYSLINLAVLCYQVLVSAIDYQLYSCYR